MVIGSIQTENGIESLKSVPTYLLSNEDDQAVFKNTVYDQIGCDEVCLIEYVDQGQQKTLMVIPLYLQTSILINSHVLSVGVVLKIK